jgi:hypothetical protein
LASQSRRATSRASAGVISRRPAAAAPVKFCRSERSEGAAAALALALAVAAVRACSSATASWETALSSPSFPGAGTAGSTETPAAAFCASRCGCSLATNSFETPSRLIDGLWQPQLAQTEAGCRRKSSTSSSRAASMQREVGGAEEEAREGGERAGGGVPGALRSFFALASAFFGPFFFPRAASPPPSVSLPLASESPLPREIPASPSSSPPFVFLPLALSRGGPASDAASTARPSLKSASRRANVSASAAFMRNRKQWRQVDLRSL